MQHLPHNHLSIAEQSSIDSVSRDRRTRDTVHRQPVRGPDRSHTSTQVLHPRGMPPRHAHRQTPRQPRDNVEFKTFDRYYGNGTLNQTNPDPTIPRHSSAHVWSLNGQPYAWSRNIDRPNRSQNLQLTNPDYQTPTPETGSPLPELTPFEESDPIYFHQERASNFEVMQAHGSQYNGSGGLNMLSRRAYHYIVFGGSSTLFVRAVVSARRSEEV